MGCNSEVEVLAVTEGDNLIILYGAVIPAERVAV
jgi:hypothetical protein